MRNFGLLAALLVGLMTLGVSGCGGSGTNEVIEATDQGGLTPEAEQSYEESMKNRGGREGN